MGRQVTITLNVAAPGRNEVERLAAPILERLGGHGEVSAEPYWKIEGTWMVTADLGVREGDSVTLVGQVLGLLGVQAPVEGDADVADATWFDDETPFEGVDWISVSASHPGQVEAEIEELVPLPPDPPLSEEEVDVLMTKLRGDDDGRG
ncbi:hypothetical protein ACIBH1_02555 [Nonomuraea sp. NPDC050663]|uniref:hypothetical protein n=1 Tax=Nonomuraea sp. NPDC050663 TaxID=3364370 RepID=UPI0037B784EF